MSSAGSLVVARGNGGNTPSATLWDNSEWINIGAQLAGPSEASAVNNSGVVVGTYYDIQGKGQAFLYSDGLTANLNNLIDPSAGYTLNEALGINDAGQIICDGTTSAGQNAAFLLTPETAPEPSILALFGICLAGIIAVKNRF